VIAYRVVAVPERRAQALALAERVGGLVVFDESHEGTFPTHVRAMGSTVGATHVVVLEDDAIVCDGFTDHVEHLVAERPDHLLGLYVGRVAPRGPQPIIETLIGTEPRWFDHPVMSENLWWAVGYVMPVVDVPTVLEHLAAGDQHPWVDSDKRLGRWHAEQGRISYPFPSPVNHDDTLPSTSTRSEHGRVAWAHCGGAG
jgi:hypothetical protein